MVLSLVGCGLYRERGYTWRPQLCLGFFSFIAKREREGDSLEGLIYLEFRGGRSGKASWRRRQIRIALDQDTRMVLLQSFLMVKFLRSVAQ